MLLFAAAEWLLARHAPLLRDPTAVHVALGGAVMFAALVPPLAAFAQFLLAHTTVNPHRPEKAAVLVTSGVYAWTRNPMYLGLWLLLLGWAIRLGALSALLVALLFLPLISAVQIRAEEQALQGRFGADYERYRGRVRRWFGRRART
jgi:protein-S-isoprenylcysteine O-methyltransferase Ste14